MVSMAGRHDEPHPDDRVHRKLAVALVALVALGPLLSSALGRPGVFGYLEAAFLLYALYQVTRRRSDLLIGLVLGLPAVAGTVIDAATPDRSDVNLAPLLFATLFIGFLVWRILGDVLGGGRVTSEQVSGAISVYLLVGFMFALVYAFVALVDPNAFAYSDAILESATSVDADQGMSIFTYFSFVTMTTLGYGDVTPVSLVARTLAFIEALLGQLYLAVMIAGLVGMHISRRSP